MSKKLKKNLNKLFVFLLITAYVLCGEMGYLDSFGMDKPTQVAFIILLISATLWISEAIPLFVTSLTILFLAKVWLVGVLQTSGIEASDKIFLAPFFSNIILLFLGGFVLSSALNKYRIDEDLAHKIISLTGKSMPLLILGIMFATAFLSMWLSNTATTAMMLALVIPIAAKLKADDLYKKAIILCVPFGANIGGIGTPVGTPPNAIALQYMEKEGIAPSFGMWMALSIPAVIIMLFILWGILLFFYKGKAKGIEITETFKEKIYTPRAIFIIVIAFITMLGWMTSSFHGYSSGTVALIPVVSFFGLGLLNVKDFRSLSWNVLILMGGGLCLGKIIDVSGLDTWLVTLLPIENTTPFTLAIFFGIISLIMSTLMSHTATANLMIPIAIGIGTSIPNLSPLLIGIAFSCSFAMALPISTPPNALAFSTEEINARELLKPGLLVSIIGLLFTFSLGWAWWSFLGIK